MAQTIKTIKQAEKKWGQLQFNEEIAEKVKKMGFIALVYNEELRSISKSQSREDNVVMMQYLYPNEMETYDRNNKIILRKFRNAVAKGEI